MFICLTCDREFDEIPDGVPIPTRASHTQMIRTPDGIVHSFRKKYQNLPPGVSEQTETLLRAPVNLPPNLKIIKYQAKPIPEPTELFEPKAVDPETPEQTPEAPEPVTVKAEDDGFIEGTICAFHPRCYKADTIEGCGAGFIREDGKLRGEGVWFSERDVATIGDLKVGVRVRFKKQANEAFKNGSHKAVQIEIYKSGENI